jgi:hypothetical protein
MVARSTTQVRLKAAVFLAVLALVLAVAPARSDDTLRGDANFAATSHGSDYLAIRSGRGTLVEICGKGDCQVMRSTDYGPAKRTGDIADIAFVRFAEICGYTQAYARIRGECTVTIRFIDEIKLPATDTDD